MRISDWSSDVCSSDLQLFQLGLEDVLGLFVGQVEARDQRRLGLVLGADDADHFVQVEEGDQQAFQQVQAALHLFQPVVEAPGDRVGAERQPLGQDRLEVLDLDRKSTRLNSSH